MGIDVGKTAVRVAIFTRALDLLESRSIPSSDPEVTVPLLSTHIAALYQSYSVASVGISLFGPLEADPNSDEFGGIVGSSELCWSGVNVPRIVRTLTRTPVRFDYDVNAGALAERKVGSAAHLDRFVYLSLGTGVGGVAYQSGIVAGDAPQIGHMYIPKEHDDEHFAGSCRFHRSCLQGLASGKAIRERWGVDARELSGEHRSWDLEARYIARACANLIYTFSPPKLVLGSAIATVPGLVAKSNQYLKQFMNGFPEPQSKVLFERGGPIEKSELAPQSSLLGAAILAIDQLGVLFA